MVKSLLITAVFSMLLVSQARADIWDYTRPANSYLVLPAAYEATICRETESERLLTLSVNAFDYENTVTSEEPTRYHCFKIEDLQPEMTYSYSFDDDTEENSQTHQFITMPDEFKPFRFAVYGDTRDGYDIHDKVIDVISDMNPAFVIHTGDLVHDGDNSDQWHIFFNVADRLFDHVPLIPVFGNHENREGTLFNNYFPVSNEIDRRYYYHDVLSCRFIVIDSETEFTDGSQQYEWLSSLLADTAEDPEILHTFATFHRPVHSSGYHGSEDLPLAETLAPLFESYGVEIVFNGHDHHYERSYREGVTYIVAGGGGAPYLPLDQPEYIPQPEGNLFREVFLGIFHAVKVEVFLDSIHLVAIDQDGEVRDDVWIGEPTETEIFPDEASANVEQNAVENKDQDNEFVLCSQVNGSAPAMLLFLLTVFLPYFVTRLWLVNKKT
jgi:predicted phosphodiesterase